MSIILATPLSFSFDGQRPNNEDFYWPDKATSDTQLFLVCDGMGGWDKGEVASRKLAQGVADYIIRHPADQLDETYLQQAIGEAHQHLIDYLLQDPAVNRMGSTLALLYIGQHGATVAHIGDSRVYHIRNGQVLFRTNDHRQVADLVSEGIITEEQAKTHPWRNRLSRSIAVDRPIANSQSNRQPDRADLVQLTDIQPDDYFFLCTDGVLEQVTDEILTACLDTDQPDSEKLANLLAHCADKTQDNYTGWLIRVADVQSMGEPEEDAQAVDEPLSDSEEPTRRGLLRWLGLTALLNIFPVFPL